MHNFKISALLISGILLLSACSSPMKTHDESANKTAEKIIDKSAGKEGTQNKDAVRPCCINPDGAIKPHDDPNSILSKRSIYFGYDSFNVDDTFKPLVEAHAKYLAANKDLKIIITGNTDERGGREYNLALGQKRAEKVLHLFSLLGVTEAQLEAISYGAERPKAEGSNEAAWAENRRVDIRY